MMPKKNDACEFFVETLNAWFARSGRDLPWRHDSTPYQVWVSELMLQQTQVETVKPYYARWMESFPDLETLARAPIEEVMRLWAGLGYYRRARYLHEGARYLVEKCGGQFPGDMAGLRRIPGVGAYTAGAIGSFAFGWNVAAVDGNVERVLARYFGIEESVSSGAGRAALIEVADRVASVGHASSVNQAMMDLGAGMCGRRARCDGCPLESRCFARVHGCADRLPCKKARADKDDEYRAAMVMHADDGTVWIARRREGALLGGLWEFPMVRLWRGAHGEASDTEVFERPRGAQWRAIWGEGMRWRDTGLRVDHVFTHIRMKVAIDEGRGASCTGEPEAAWLERALGSEYETPVRVSVEEIPRSYAVSSLMSKILAAYAAHPKRAVLADGQ